MRRLLYPCLLGACATAGTEQPSANIDASDADATMIDAAPDAPLPCTEVMTELLKNPAFDGTPMGSMWMQTPINATYPLITDQGQTGTSGITEQSAPYDAWLGGLAGTDVLWQDVTIPGRTKQIALSGFYEVRTGETVANAVDTGSLAFTDTANTPIATIQALDNTKKTTTWTTVNYAVTNAPMYSGMTIRLRMTSTNNGTLFTSFWWDTLSIKATHCMEQ
jgi:hypothetical protein